MKSKLFIALALFAVSAHAETTTWNCKSETTAFNRGTSPVGVTLSFHPLLAMVGPFIVSVIDEVKGTINLPADGIAMEFAGVSHDQSLIGASMPAEDNHVTFPELETIANSGATLGRNEKFSVEFDSSDYIWGRSTQLGPVRVEFDRIADSGEKTHVELALVCTQ